ncbi:MAG: YidC/Oxa1 family membrane protein insertase [Lactobacillaceae bacterium]|jgi:YidC/Oxa1 family membrane protein insertase|nr:YidC/Oxa1 family membrane protein insertase [Lactobacillaceae bacterium]
MNNLQKTKNSFIEKVGILPLVVAGISLILIIVTSFFGHPKANYSGFFAVIVSFFSKSILGISSLFNNSYGMGIIVFTILVRFLVLPLMIFQIESSKKMSVVTPFIKEIQNKYKGKRDSSSLQAMQSETSAVYKEYGVNPYASLLPLVIQLPILMALYWSIFQTPELQEGKFLWFQLGQTDPLLILPILAAIFTFISSWMSMASMQGEQPAFAKFMPYFFPIIIFFSGINLPSALSLYWTIGNFFQVVQTFFLQNPFKIRKENKEKEKIEKLKKKAINKKLKKVHKKRK